MTMSQFYIKPFLILFIALSLNSFSQDSIPTSPPKHWLGANIGSLVTELKYTSSDGSELDYTKELNFQTGLAYSFLSKSLLIDINLDYYSLSSSYYDDNIASSINLGYFQPSLNLSYLLALSNTYLKPRIGLGVGYGMLINGTQNLNGELIELKHSETLNNGDLGVNFNAGVVLVKYSGTSLSALYNYRLGVSNIENASNNQETFTSAHGLLFKIQMGL